MIVASRLTSGQSSSLVLGSRGVKFKLADHFHLPHYIQAVPFKLWTGLTLLSCGAGLMVVVVDLLAREIGALRTGVCSTVPGNLAWIPTVITGAVLAFLAAVLVTVEPGCGGSGLPEVKATLSGVVLFNSLTLRTLLLKPLALVLAVSSGLSIGKEGALVHSACCLAHQITESKYIGFNKLRIEQRRVELMVAACAVGVVRNMTPT